MADKLTFVQSKDGVDGFKSAAEAEAWAQKSGGHVLTAKAAVAHQRAYDVEGIGGKATAAAVNAGFGLPKLAIAALGDEDTKAYVEAAEARHPLYGVAGSFIAPWGAAGKLAGAGARGLMGLGEAAEAASIFSKGSALEGAAARGAEALGTGATAAEARSISPLLADAAAAARPGIAGEVEGLAGRALTREGAGIVEAMPKSFLEAAIREGGLNAGVSALNTAGDYLLSERYMDGHPREDAEGLVPDLLKSALFGGALGAGAGLVAHGAGRALDNLFNPANAPKLKIPEAVREHLETAFRQGGHSAEEAAKKAATAIEHGVAATGLDSPGYNRLSAMLENARVKRALERGEIQLPRSMAGEHDLAQFVEDVAQKAHEVRGGAKLASATDQVGEVAAELEGVANTKRGAVVAAAREKFSPELAKHFVANPYNAELASAATEARALGGEESAKLLEKAHGLMKEGATSSRVARIQALDLIERAAAKAPQGFDLAAERQLVLGPLQHEANGKKFLGALAEHQLADKARRELGALAGSFKGGQAPTLEAVAGLESAAKSLGLENAGGLEKAFKDHYVNEAARVIGKEAKAVDPTLKMMGGMLAGKLASKALGGFGLGGYAGLRAGEFLAQAASDPIAASGVVRKAMAALRYGAEDTERLARGLAAQGSGKASLMNLAENATPLGKVLWDTAPGRTARMVGQALENGFREVLPSMPQRAAHGLMVAKGIEDHLAEHEPKPIMPKGVSPAAMVNLPPRYNEREVREYQGRLLATVAPKQVIERYMNTGYLPKETADTLRVTHPALIQKVVAQGAAELAKLPEAQRYEAGRRLEALAGPGGGLFTRTSTPGFVSAVQQSYQATAPAGPAGQPGGGPGAGGSSGNASPQGKPGPGGATYAPVTIMRGVDGKFLQQTQAAPSAALSTSMGDS